MTLQQLADAGLLPSPDTLDREARACYRDFLQRWTLARHDHLHYGKTIHAMDVTAWGLCSLMLEHAKSTQPRAIADAACSLLAAALKTYDRRTNLPFNKDLADFRDEQVRKEMHLNDERAAFVEAELERICDENA